MFVETKLNYMKKFKPFVADLIRFYYQDLNNSSGGCFHILLDDGNIEDHSLDFCMKEAEKKNDTFGIFLGRVLGLFSEDEREAMYEDDWRGVEQKLNAMTNNQKSFPEVCLNFLEIAYIESSVIIYDRSKMRISIPAYVISAILRNELLQLTISSDGTLDYRGIQVVDGYENKIIIYNIDVAINGKTKETYFEKQIP